MQIRKVEASDAAQLLEIYKPAVLNNHISFELEVPNIDEFKNRIISISSNYPWLVLTDKEQILGYCYATKFRERAAYAPTAETAIYMSNKAKGKGFGKLLYLELLKQLQYRDYHSAIGVIALPNLASEAFHQACGFKKTGSLEQSGFKNNKWWDIAFYQKIFKP